MITAIFLPGLYGSTLHSERNGARRWPALGEILFRRRTLAASAGDTLRAGSVLDRFVVVPGVYSVDVYGDALAGLRRRSGANVQWREFAYDWRSELSTQAQSLDAAVDAELARGRRVALVAHSLGGLLACYYLRYGSQRIEQARETWAGAAKVDRVVLAGVPFGGSALALVDLVDGRRIAGNGRILDAATYRSFGATWQLLPADAPLIDSRAAAVPMDLFDSREWQRLGFVSATTDVTQSLAAANGLRMLLAQPPIAPPSRRLPMLLVQGSGRPTLERVVGPTGANGSRLIDNVQQWRRVDAQAAHARHLFGDGDGVVTMGASAAPSIWNETATVQTLQIPRGHRRLLHDPVVQEQIALLLRPDGGGSAAPVVPSA
jgi:alpha-beta hydrolase superfamily lysophospholipase